MFFGICAMSARQTCWRLAEETLRTWELFHFSDLFRPNRMRIGRD